MPKTKLPNPYRPQRQTARLVVLLEPEIHEWAMTKGGSAFARELIETAKNKEKKKP